MFSSLKLKEMDMDGDSETSEKTYKSCFARSVVVNSKFQDTRAAAKSEIGKKQSVLQEDSMSFNFPPKKEHFTESTKFNQKQQSNKDGRTVDNIIHSPSFKMESVSYQKQRESYEEYQVRISRTKIRKDSVDSSSMVPDFSVENLVLKSQLETLQWQLKQTEESRQMYQAVMRQVVSFLERAHRSLEHLGSKLIITNKQNVTRCLSQHEVSNYSEEHQQQDESKASIEKNGTDYTAFRDFTWRRPKKEQASPEETPPEKLSQEAFRLLRTAESLLNTQEPDLAHLAGITTNRSPSPASSTGQFDGSPEKHFRRPSFAASSPQLACSEATLTRKAVLRRQHALKCNSFHAETLSYKSSDSHDFDLKEFSSLANENVEQTSRRTSISSQISTNAKRRTEPETSVTPPMSSVSSAEDESGFSSMNSFQELGIPIVSYEEVGAKSKEALLRSMLHENGPKQNNHSPQKTSQKDRKLWQTPDNYGHKRWNSTPAETKVQLDKPLKVLWV